MLDKTKVDRAMSSRWKENVRHPGIAGNVQIQPVNGGGISGGIFANRTHETAEIAFHVVIIVTPTREAISLFINRMKLLLLATSTAKSG